MTVDPRVLSAYGFADATLARVNSGLINTTYRVERGGQPVAVLQRLHSVFEPEVNADIDAVTSHLASRGCITPRVLQTVGGELWVSIDDATWRALSFIEGRTHEKVDSSGLAEEAGRVAGAFHRAVADLDHKFGFARAGVHDTDAHLATLATQTANADTACDEQAAAVELSEEIRRAAESMPVLPASPQRICHGDLKISNLLFDDDDVGICLIDLDTLGMGTLAYELGDALRSWANPDGEDRPTPAFRLDIAEPAIRGFRAGAGDCISESEFSSVAAGLERVCLELAARFCADVFSDSYFGWDPARFPSRRAHNLLRSRGQLALGLSVRQHRDALQKLLRT